MCNVSLRGAAPRAVALLFLAAFFGAAPAARMPGQSGRVPPKLEQQQTKPAADDDEEEGESESVSRPAPARPQTTDPATILRKARFVLVRSDSTFISGHEVEDSLRKRKEFQAWGMVVTRSESEADLVIEITRKPLTRRFTFSVIDPRTMEVVASGKTRSVLFGKKISNKIAEKFANRVKVYRPYQ